MQLHLAVHGLHYTLSWLVFIWCQCNRQEREGLRPNIAKSSENSNIYVLQPSSCQLTRRRALGTN